MFRGRFPTFFYAPFTFFERLKCKSTSGNNEKMVCSLVRSTSGVKRVCWSSGMRIKISDKWVNYSHKLAQPKQ